MLCSSAPKGYKLQEEEVWPQQPSNQSPSFIMNVNEHFFKVLILIVFSIVVTAKAKEETVWVALMEKNLFVIFRSSVSFLVIFVYNYL